MQQVRCARIAHENSIFLQQPVRKHRLNTPLVTPGFGFISLHSLNLSSQLVTVTLDGQN